MLTVTVAESSSEPEFPPCIHSACAPHTPASSHTLHTTHTRTLPTHPTPRNPQSAMSVTRIRWCLSLLEMEIMEFKHVREDIQLLKEQTQTQNRTKREKRASEQQ